jgi:glycosyltransferase involved in cell wall biosynthesis
MRVLIWNPIWVLGGGYHLMTNLIEQLSNHPSVSKLTAAINPKYGGQIDKHLLGERSSKVFVDLQSDLAEYATVHDIVFATWPHGMPPPNVNIPTVAIYHDTILLDAYGGHTTRDFIETIQREVKQTVQRYTRTIVTSNYTKQRLLQVAGHEFNRRIEVLPYIASQPMEAPKRVARPGTFPVATTPNHSPTTSRPYLLYPSNVAEHKNHLSMFVALSKRRRRDVQLGLCGHGTESIGLLQPADNQYLNRLNKAIANRGIQRGRDYFTLGYLDEAGVEDLWKNTWALIMPTRGEGMGLPIHEAIDRKIPVILSDLPVLREHYAGRSDALIWIDPDCPSELAHAWDYVCDHRMQLLETAQRNRPSQRSWHDIGNATVEILEAVNSSCSRHTFPFQKQIKQLWNPNKFLRRVSGKPPNSKQQAA